MKRTYVLNISFILFLKKVSYDNLRWVGELNLGPLLLMYILMPLFFISNFVVFLVNVLSFLFLVFYCLSSAVLFSLLMFLPLFVFSFLLLVICWKKIGLISIYKQDLIHTKYWKVNEDIATLLYTIPFFVKLKKCYIFLSLLSKKVNMSLVQLTLMCICGQEVSSSNLPTIAFITIRSKKKKTRMKMK